MDRPPRILFVCLGNICRSPTAEGVFRGLAAEAGLDCEIDSAGTSAYHTGEMPDARASAEALSRGFDLSDQRSRQIEGRDFLYFDYIIGMDRSNMHVLKDRAPSGTKGKLHMMLDFAADAPVAEVPDPYYNDQFDAVFDMIEDASRGLIARLQDEQA